MGDRDSTEGRNFAGDVWGGVFWAWGGEFSARAGRAGGRGGTEFFYRSEPADKVNFDQREDFFDVGTKFGGGTKFGDF